MTITANELGNNLVNTFKSKNIVHSIEGLQQFRESMKDVEIGASLVAWITEPANLTLVQRALIDDLEIPPRLLAIKRMNMSRTQKAVLLTHAMELAIKKVYKL
jgi:hypothetical protein